MSNPDDLLIDAIVKIMDGEGSSNIKEKKIIEDILVPSVHAGVEDIKLLAFTRVNKLVSN